MMSGGNISYNLRPNKFVERQLFIDLLGKICLKKSQDNYVYISLGGPQLEDHKTIHQVLGFSNLVSIEADPVVYQRQLFNVRPYYVKCRKETTGDFIANFDRFVQDYEEKEFIIWLDYAAASKRFDQLVEYQTLLSKLEVGDILKITMNSNPYSLGEKEIDELGEPCETDDAYRTRLFQKLKEQLKNYFPNKNENAFTDKDINARRFPSILCNAIHKASKEAMQNRRGVQAFPLAIFCYQDGNHLMLTVTVMLLKNSEELSFKSDLNKQGWKYIPENWESFTRINVPHLTAKERLYIESVLFSKEHKEVHAELPFKFAKGDDESLKIFEQYADHYRRYPSYFQVVL